MIANSVASPWAVAEQSASHCSREKWSETAASQDTASIEIQAWAKWIFKTSIPSTNECPEPLDVEENMTDG